MKLLVITQRESTIAICSYQYGAVMALKDGTDTRGQLIRERIMYKRLTCCIETVKSAVGSHPETSLTITEQFYNHVYLQRRLVVFIVKESLEVIAVKAIEAIISCYPH